MVTSEGAWRVQLIPSWGGCLKFRRGVAESLASGSEGSESGTGSMPLHPLAAAHAVGGFSCPMSLHSAKTRPLPVLLAQIPTCYLALEPPPAQPALGLLPSHTRTWCALDLDPGCPVVGHGTSADALADSSQPGECWKDHSCWHGVCSYPE